MDDVALTDWLSLPFRGRKVIVAYRVLAGMKRAVDDLHAWGAQRPLLVSVGRGTGAVPEPDTFDLVEIDSPSPPTLTDEVRYAARLAADPPAEVVAEVEAVSVAALLSSDERIGLCARIEAVAN